MSRRACLALLCGLALARITGAAEPLAFDEYKLKAAFLFNFAKFVEWPGSSLGDNASPLVIGVFGENPFGAELEAIVKNPAIRGRAIVIKRMDSAEDAKTAHVLFFSGKEDYRVARTLAALKRSSVLTVGESEGFAEAGGIIRFTREGDKLRFEIDMGAAARAGLKISAHLQKLAQQVRRSE